MKKDIIKYDPGSDEPDYQFWKERLRSRLTSTALLLVFAAALAGCNDTLESATYDTRRSPTRMSSRCPGRILAEIQKKGMERNSPFMLRIFKEEGKLEVWKAKTNNRFDMIASYDICAWSGRLGPKIKEGDQAPRALSADVSPEPNSNISSPSIRVSRTVMDQANGRSGTN